MYEWQYCYVLITFFKVMYQWRYCYVLITLSKSCMNDDMVNNGRMQDTLCIYSEHLWQGVTDRAMGKKTLHKSKHQSVTPQLLQIRMNAKICYSLKTKMAINSGRDSTNKYTQFSPQILLQVEFSCNILRLNPILT